MSERLKSIVAEMRIRPNDDVLEIGCGHGVAASFVCEKLDSGRLVAIDRSQKMIAAAIRRNKLYIDAGKAEFHATDVLSFDPAGRKFDTIFAVRVALLHREATARAVIQKWLKPRGRIFLFYDEP